MTSQQEIVRVMKILKRNTHKFQSTSLMEISQVTKSPFQVLVSCILSLRTKDAVTASASRRLYRLATVPAEMLKLSENQIAEAVYPVGFYKTKAKRIREICSVLIEKYSGEVPQTMHELLELKGVGRKTAGIVLCYGHNKNECIPVDSHVHQVVNRLGWVKTKTPEKTEQELLRMVPRRYWRDFNDLFVQFGQNICVPVSPWCSRCPVFRYCKRVSVKKRR